MSQVREHWSSRFGFIMASIGSAIGLGILWKFPYTVGQNGGGLFLLSYFICLILVGIPLFIAELILGRGSQKAAVKAFETQDKKGSGWKVAGWFGVLSSFLIMSFYSVIAGWGMSYVIMSLTGFYQGVKGPDFSQVFDSLSTSGGITLFWHFLFTLITTMIVTLGVRKGVEYWAKLMTKVLLILLTLLFLYALSLKGFGPAVRFIFFPKMSAFNFSSVIEALGLAFWTLSIGQGIMISYGSYMKREESIPQMAGIVAFSVIVVAILTALTIFPIVFTFDLPPQAGPGLIFKTMPTLFAQLPGSLLISTMFFSLFVFTALTSAIPLIEVVATNIMELIGWNRKKAVVVVGLSTFAFGIPSALARSHSFFPDWQQIYGMDFLKTIDHLVSIWIIPLGGLITTLFVGWAMDRKAVKGEFQFGMRFPFLVGPWLFFIRWVVPVTIVVIILQSTGLLHFDTLFLAKKGVTR